MRWMNQVSFISRHKVISEHNLKFCSMLERDREHALFDDVGTRVQRFCEHTAHVSRYAEQHVDENRSMTLSTC